MKICCLDDKGGWGRAVKAEADKRGWKTSLFTAPEAKHQNGDYAFMRLAQDARQLVDDKAALGKIIQRGIKPIPDATTCLSYEDKWAQTLHYARYMPDTALIGSREVAEVVLRALGFPFISKSKTGSASRNVRLIENVAQAQAEIDAAFGNGLAAPHKLGEGKQEGYLIWQEFIPGNAYDYRIVRTGKKMMILQRHNRLDLPFASGSGKNNPAPITREAAAALKFADAFFDEEVIPWCGIDVVYNSIRQGWHLLETTVGWSQKAYEACRYYTVEDGEVRPTHYMGSDIWRLLCDEIEDGAFQ